MVVKVDIFNTRLVQLMKHSKAGQDVLQCQKQQSAADWPHLRSLAVPCLPSCLTCVAADFCVVEPQNPLPGAPALGETGTRQQVRS